MPRVYRLFGVDLASDVPLPAPPAEGEGPTWTATIGAGAPPTHGATWALGDHAPAAPFDQGRAGETYFLHIHDLAVFAIDEATRTLRAWPAEGVPDLTLAHLIVDQALPRALTLSGALLLHASGVLIDGQGVLFEGPSGVGKSTLATAFSKAGYPLLSDDGMLLRMRGEQVWGWGSYPGVRLWPDSAARLLRPGEVQTEVAHYAPKVRAEPGDAFTFERRAVPIARIHLLEEAPATGPLSIQTVSPADAFARLTAGLLRLDFGRPALLRGEFEALSAVCDHAAVRRLRRPLDYDALPEVMAAVVDEVRG